MNDVRTISKHVADRIQLVSYKDYTILLASVSNDLGYYGGGGINSSTMARGVQEDF